MKLLTIANSKTTKGEAAGYLTGILYLAPADLSGVNLCPYSSPGCRAACLNTAGRGAFKSIQESRVIKTLGFLNNREGFIEQLHDDIKALRRLAFRLGLTPVVRLNGTSDITWERVAPELMHANSDIQFYDYTKYPPTARISRPANYHLTYSASEETGILDVRAALDAGLNVAVVFRADELPSTYFGHLVIDGDAHDLRFLDPRGVIVGLKAKGKAKRDETGFARRLA